LPLNVSVREFGDHNAALDSFESEWMALEQ
jgi:hypothetical protein